MAHDYRNHGAFGEDHFKQIFFFFFRVIFIRFDLAEWRIIHGPGMKEMSGCPEAGHGQEQNSKHTGNSGETDSIYDSYTSQVIEQVRGKIERGPRASFWL